MISFFNTGKAVPVKIMCKNCIIICLNAYICMVHQEAINDEAPFYMI